MRMVELGVSDFNAYNQKDLLIRSLFTGNQAGGRFLVRVRTEFFGC